MATTTAAARSPTFMRNIIIYVHSSGFLQICCPNSALIGSRYFKKYERDSAEKCNKAQNHTSVEQELPRILDG